MKVIKQVEIFAAGLWNGIEFSNEDLKLIAFSFDKLKDKHKVPLKMGHNDKQPFTDGQPALGWIEKVWLEGNKLMAKLVDLPDVVFSAISNKLYKKVSIELEVSVNHKDDFYPFVLSGVALLGADIPAVNTLADLTAYMSREEMTFKKRMAFTAIKNEVNKEGFKMPTQEEFDALQAKLNAANAVNNDHEKSKIEFAKSKAESDIEFEKLKSEAKVAKDEAEKVKFAAEKVSFTDKLESLVKSNAITPAQREQFTKDFDTNKDQVTYAVNAMSIGTSDKGLNIDDKSKSKSNNDDDKTPDVIVLTRAKELMLKTGSSDFMACKYQVLRLDDDLAKEYANMNGEA